MLHWILRKLSGQPKSKQDFTKHWNERVRAQHDRVQKAGFFPVSDEALALSGAQYFDQGHRSAMFAQFNLTNRCTIFPLRALYATGATLMMNSGQGHSATLAMEGACRFRLAAMEAALSFTPTDLLILMDSRSCLPSPASWEQSEEWRTKAFPSDIVASEPFLWRHAAALFLDRIDTPAADFLAFKEAASVLSSFELFDDKTDFNGTSQKQLGFVISDIFPTLRARERDLLIRQRLLEKCQEMERKNFTFPEHLIGVDGFGFV